MRKRNIKSIAHWSIMSVLLLFPVLMVGISAFQNADYEPKTVYTDVESIDDSLLNKTLYFDIKTSVVAPSSSNGGNNKYLYFDNLDIIANNSAGDSTNAKGIAFYIATSGNVINAWWLYEDNTLSSGFNSSSSVIFTCDYLGNDLANATIQWLLDNEVFKIVSFVDNYHYKNDVNYWVDSFINLPVNSWYKSLMNVIGVGFTTSSVMNVIYVMPLYILWVYILDLIVDCLLVIINFGHDALQRLGADNE